MRSERGMASLILSRCLPVAVLVIAAAGASGCRSLLSRSFGAPVIEVRDIRVKGLGLTGGTVELHLSVYNPNEFRLDARRLTYRLYVDSTDVGTGMLDNHFMLRGRDSTVVVLPVAFTFAGLGAAARILGGTGTLNYRVVGDITVATPVGAVTKPYDQSGQFTIFGQSRTAGATD